MNRSDYVLAGGGGPNPGHVGACAECGSFRADGRPPYLHRPGCSAGDASQAERFVSEFLADDINGPTIWQSRQDDRRAAP
jgi:hypothetical protein